MKKYIKYIIIFLIIALIVGVFILNNKYNSSGVYNESDILKEMTESDIKNDNDKINIYLFWGSGCAHCKELSQFIFKIQNKYSKYYNLYTFETWNNTENEEFLNNFSTFMGKEASGVPYLVIGDKVFAGYNSSNDDAIKEKIKSEYDSKERYDAYQNYKNK